MNLTDKKTSDNPSSNVSILPDYIKNVKLMNKPDLKENIKHNTDIKIKRCGVKDCNRRIGITNSFECKCGQITCIAHRYPKDHQCTIDHKQIAKDKLTKDNPVVIADKITNRIK